MAKPTLSPAAKREIAEIARVHLHIETLERRWSDSLDFHDLAAYSTRWRTRFHADGGQCSSVMADSVPR